MVRIRPEPAMTARPRYRNRLNAVRARPARPVWRSLLSALALCALAVPGGALCADVGHREAQRLRESGRILPLETIVQRAQALHPGKLLDIELEREDGRYVYELELLDERGVVWELEYDAATGTLLQRKRED
jgi:Peptidase propeptide and YPEB domain